ncbi:hypothetical protein [uncultured Parabacteroides sp.]|uniref:hypothetical protein n=1 Tax=uncultured Parabacteroides sp. TaxID=512312 RepID=UPI0026384B27|nr:hypothetical protein [uncultured Parabacteroides sp.]
MSSLMTPNVPDTSTMSPVYAPFTSVMGSRMTKAVRSPNQRGTQGRIGTFSACRRFMRMAG